MIIGCTEMPGLGDGTRVANWVSYDAVVESYERYHVDRGYALPARDTVLMLGLADGQECSTLVPEPARRLSPRLLSALASG
jgi:hypothetical protein